MALGCIAILSLSWEIIIAMYLLKRVEYDMGSSLLKRQVAQILQSFYSTLIIVPCTLKAMPVALLLYLLLKSPWTITIYIYYTWSIKSIHIWILDLEVNQFRGDNPEHNTIKNLFTPNLRLWKKLKDTVSLVLPTTLYLPQTN